MDLKNFVEDDNFKIIKVGDKVVYKCVPCDFTCNYDNHKWQKHITRAKHIRNFDKAKMDEYLKHKEEKESFIKCEPCDKIMSKQYYDIYHVHTTLHKNCTENNQPQMYCKYCKKYFTKYYMNFHSKLNRHIENVKKYNCEVPDIK